MTIVTRARSSLTLLAFLGNACVACTGTNTPDSSPDSAGTDSSGKDTSHPDSDTDSASGSSDADGDGWLDEEDCAPTDPTLPAWASEEVYSDPVLGAGMVFLGEEHPSIVFTTSETLYSLGWDTDHWAATSLAGAVRDNSSSGFANGTFGSVRFVTTDAGTTAFVGEALSGEEFEPGANAYWTGFNVYNTSITTGTWSTPQRAFHSPSTYDIFTDPVVRIDAIQAFRDPSGAAAFAVDVEYAGSIGVYQSGNLWKTGNSWTDAGHVLTEGADIEGTHSTGWCRQAWDEWQSNTDDLTADTCDELGYAMGGTVTSSLTDDMLADAWYDETSQDLDLAVRVGGTWTRSVLDYDGDVGFGAASVIDARDRVHVIYVDKTNEVAGYRMWADGTSSSVQTLTGAGTAGAWTIALDSNGLPSVLDWSSGLHWFHLTCSP